MAFEPPESEVLSLQKDLNKIGVQPPLSEDGKLGPKTWGANTAQIHKDAGGGDQTHPGEKVKGIDIYDGDQIQDWAKIAAAGIKFCFIKVTQGTYNTQKKYKQNVDGARAHGILTGPYHFADFKNSGESQAAHFLSKLEAAGGLADDQLPPVFDWEYLAGTSPKASRDNPIAKAFLEKVAEVTKRTPIIYMSASLPDELGNPDWLLDYPLWVAHYRAAGPILRDPYDSWDFWQYTDSVEVSGLNGGDGGDGDVFSGDLAALQKFIQDSKV